MSGNVAAAPPKQAVSKKSELQKLVLTGAGSFTSGNLHVVKDKTFEVDADKAEKLLKTGMFKRL